ncbi:MAG: CaiB/BaiF CoA-transferase family protein [Bacteroidales bacterium]|nr:CaiB/BaiF CoA-transferase family protein [Bacteroidales bacterium]
MSSNNLPLKNIKILELASVLAGPSVGMFFAELGATVIKVENLVTNGDVTRNWKLPTEADDDISGYFSSVNWGKLSLAIDITRPEGLEIIHKLTTQCDIVLASYKPGDDKKLKVDYETLSALNPELIYAHLTGYGLNNPRPGFDAIIQAEAGFTYMNGEADSMPVKMPVALMDVLAAHHLKEAILISLLKRINTGRGEYIDVSLIRSGIASLVNQATNWLVGNSIPERLGSDHPNIVPYGTLFKTADNKEIVLAVGTEKHFHDLCAVLDAPELFNDLRFKTNKDRVNHKEALKELLRKKFLLHERDAMLEKLNAKRIPAGSVNNMKEVFETDEAKEMLLQDTINRGITGVRSVAFRFNRNGLVNNILPPPHYGDSTTEVLSSWLGFKEQYINDLIEKQVIYAKK